MNFFYVKCIEMQYFMEIMMIVRRLKRELYELTIMIWFKSSGDCLNIRKYPPHKRGKMRLRYRWDEDCLLSFVDRAFNAEHGKRLTCLPCSQNRCWYISWSRNLALSKIMEGIHVYLKMVFTYDSSSPFLYFSHAITHSQKSLPMALIESEQEQQEGVTWT